MVAPVFLSRTVIFFEKNEDRLVDIISALAEAKFLDVQGHLPLNCRLNLNLGTYLTISRAVSVY